MGRNLKVGGRAIVKSFSYSKNFDENVCEIEVICKREGTTFSELIVELLKKYYKEHAKSQNPQTLITLFESGLENAIPNVYVISRDPKILEKFYTRINNKEEYDEIDKCLNIWLGIHDKKGREFR